MTAGAHGMSLVAASKIHIRKCKSLTDTYVLASAAGPMKIRAQAERGSGAGVKVFSFIAESVFTFIPNPVQAHPATAFRIIPESRSPFAGFPGLELEMISLWNMSRCFTIDGMRPIRLLLALSVTGFGLLAQVSAVVNINPAQSTSLNSNFSGFNDEVVFPAEYFDYRLEALAGQLTPGWVRYPSGSFSLAFDWQTGLMVPGWVSQFQGTSVASLLDEGLPWANGKGGGSFIDAANRANFLGAKLIVCVNAYTDTAQSAGQMAAYAVANGIHVAVWELANEPYLYPTFFSSGADYATKMKPYRDAIKAADPSAVVAIFFEDAGDPTPDPAWDQSLGAYSDQYWDAVTYHQYPAQSTGAFSQWMAAENAVLTSKTSTYVTGHLAPLNPPGMKFLISEFLPTNDGQSTNPGLTTGTLYGAIYAAEYVMRMSSVPSMQYVGMHALTGTTGVYAVTTNYTAVDNAYSSGAPIDTLSLNFGYFLDAQPLGLGVLNGVLRNAAQVDSTTVSGGSTVAATGLGQIPALYAQAYTASNGLQSVVITNKGATANQVTMQINGTPVSGTLPVTFIAGSDPTAQNTASSQDSVAIQTSTSTNPLTIPAYSVVRVDLNSTTKLTGVNSGSFATGPAAAHEIVALFGQGLASQTLAALLQPLPTSLAGTSVQITDSRNNVQLAPLFSVSPAQVNIEIPEGLAAGTATVSVLIGPALSSRIVQTGTLTIAGSAPALFTANADGAGVAAAIAFLANSANQATFETVLTCNPPAPRSCLGSPLSLGAATETLYVELFGTGIRGAASVQCFVGGQSVPVLYAGSVASLAGLDQVNISLPRSLAGAGDVSVYLVADGVSSNVVGLTIQ